MRQSYSKSIALYLSTILLVFFLYESSSLSAVYAGSQEPHPNPDTNSLTVVWSILFHNGERYIDTPHTICTIPLQGISYYFQDVCNVCKKHQNNLDQLRSLYQESFEEQTVTGTEKTTPYKFFKRLLTESIYSYVLLDDKFIFTEIKQNICSVEGNCRANKHAFLSSQQAHVRMAGEFKVHQLEDKIYIKFDNSSGTYTPSPEKVHLLTAFLRNTLQHDSLVEFIGTELQ